ncbi:unnamed protein product [Rotaria sp. Silwood2]|nr:unnamed protein product [Rotaria sp. Silwood2]CAF2556239.1 unnamed protein product [Rotaria sp. Silwood2]CAF2979756.1 unnamed protein product [Rotaria sp. Silwood2]CAF3851525.1 unnamed protein product [Rotaria sp. Silwood2]CAF3867586.1 unnamed protein product [Rotaria sp. Silwood2]
MHHRRSQGDIKSTSSINGLSSSMSTTNNFSSTSTTGRVSIYSMRERVILNKMTNIMGKLAPDTETEVTGRLHQEIPAIKLDGHLIYCLYTALQNLIHLNAIYILLYHAAFWLSSNDSHKETIFSSKILEQTNDEQTHFITVSNNYYSIATKSINTDLINIYIYMSLVAIGSFEVIITFIWTIRKKLPYLIQRNQKLRNRLNKLLILMLILIYIAFITWILFHTFITHQLTLTFLILVFGHLVILTFLDKPNLFQRSPDNLSKQSTIARKQQRHSTSSSSTSSIATSILARPSHRSSTSMLPRKINPVVSSSASSSDLISWSRWSSVIEEKIEIHECSTFYAQARREADDLWPIVARRIILNFYRTFASFILFDLIPIKMTDNRVRSMDSQPLKMLIFIFTLSTFVTHSAFLFPVKLQTTVHRIATHLGQWRQQSNIRTDTINEWSSECNSYTRGSVVKLSSNNQYYIAIQHLSNAANPQSKSHSILYRLFGDPTYFLTVQFLLSMTVIILHIIWSIFGRHWEQILVSYLIIFYSSYPTFKIIRDRIIMDFVDEHEYVQASTTSKQKKLS